MSNAIDDTNYKSKINAAKRPVLLIFGASFCGPSAQMDPLIDELVGEFADDVTPYDVDVEGCPNLTHEMQIKGTPSMVLIKDSTPVASRIGTSSYKDLSEWLTKNLEK